MGAGWPCPGCPGWGGGGACGAGVVCAGAAAWLVNGVGCPGKGAVGALACAVGAPGGDAGVAGTLPNCGPDLSGGAWVALQGASGTGFEVGGAWAAWGATADGPCGASDVLRVAV
jgi:hypothetical protein